MRTARNILTVSFLAMGCARYRALPLDSAAERAALASPDPERIELEASRIRHPLLQPVHLDLAEGLTPDQAAVAAVLGNPGLRAVRDGRQLAEAQVVQAGLLPNPAFSFEHDQPTGSNPTGTVTGHSAQLDWDLNALWERGLKRRAAAAQARAVDLGVAWQEWQVAQAARVAAFHVLAAEEQLPLARTAMTEARTAMESWDRAAGAGAASGAASAASHAEYGQARQSLIRLEEAGTQAKQELNGLLGLPPEAPLPLRKAAPLPAWEDLPPEPDLVQGLGERRLDLLAFKQGYASRDTQLRLAIRQQFPPIGILLDQARDTGGVVTLGLGARLQLPFFDRNQGHIAEERATRRQLYDEYQARLFTARAQIAELFARLAGIRKRIAAAEEALGSLEASAEAYGAAQETGAVDLVSAGKARLVYLAQALAVARLRAERADLGVQLEVASGRYMPDGAIREAAPEPDPAQRPFVPPLRQESDPR